MTTSEAISDDTTAKEYLSQLAELQCTLYTDAAATGRSLTRIITAYNSSTPTTAPITGDVLAAYNRLRGLVWRWRSQQGYQPLTILARECEQVEALEWLLNTVATQANSRPTAPTLPPPQIVKPALRWWQKLGMS
jgi:hypothetical protein